MGTLKRLMAVAILVGSCIALSVGSSAPSSPLDEIAKKDATHSAKLRPVISSAQLPLVSKQQASQATERTSSIRNLESTADINRSISDIRKLRLHSRDDYYRAVLELCNVLGASASKDPSRGLIARRLATEALDEPGDKPIDCQVRLILLIRSDPDYSNGSLSDAGWAEARRTRAARWLGVWRDLRTAQTKFRSNSGSTEVLSDARREPVPNELGEEPTRGTEKNRTSNLKDELIRSERLFVGPAKRYLTEAYCKPPYNTPELEQLLSGSSVDEASRSAILTEVRRRVTERPAPTVPFLSSVDEASRPAILAEVRRRFAERPAPTVPPPAGVAPKVGASPSPPPSFAPITWRTDPRLRAGVTMDLKSPTVDDVLRELRRATGVDLSRADDVQQNTAALGSLSTRAVPAWQIMEQLAASKRVEGTWEPDGDGYRLVSNGAPVRITDPGPAVPAEPAEPGRRVVLLVVLGALALVFALLTVTVLSRYRARRATPPPDTPQGAQA
jgi:hypothetical protein